MTEEDKRIAAFAKALSNPTRIAIIRILQEQGKCTCGENCPGAKCNCGCSCGSLVERFPMAQSTISQHIKELRTAGFITLSCRKGNYKLNQKIINEGLTSIIGLFDKTLISDMEEKKNCQCGENCDCGENCQCGDTCNCGENCQCGENCNCGENCECTEDNKCSPECMCN